jgi:hypothetical protein
MDRRIIDAKDLVGKLDMRYDWELSDFEAFRTTSNTLDSYGVLYFHQLRRDYNRKQ